MIPSRRANLGYSGSDGRLAGEESSSSCGTALLRVPAEEHRTFFADAIDVGRLVAHVTAVAEAGVIPTDVVTHDDQDVGLLRTAGLLRVGRSLCGRTARREKTQDGKRHHCLRSKTQPEMHVLYSFRLYHSSFLRVFGDRGLRSRRFRRPHAAEAKMVAAARALTFAPAADQVAAAVLARTPKRSSPQPALLLARFALGVGGIRSLGTSCPAPPCRQLF